MLEYLLFVISCIPLVLAFLIGGLWWYFRPPVKRNFQAFQRTHTRGYRGR